MNFVAIDFETANSELSSICQVGVAIFHQGKLQSGWETLVNPQADFDFINISIHGITEEKVQGAPTWCEVYPRVEELLGDKIVVSHTAFDRAALRRACEQADISAVECRWLDSARVVRRTWECFARSGYGLSSVAEYLGIVYLAHNALEDARCAGEILVKASVESGISIEDWVVRSVKPIHPAQNFNSATFDPNPDGPLFGSSITFTGQLSLNRFEAATLAAAAGCEVAASVSKQTTLLIVGDQDARKLAGYEKSAKHRRAEQLILRGQQIRILSEADFLRTVAEIA